MLSHRKLYTVGYGLKQTQEKIIFTVFSCFIDIKHLQLLEEERSN